MHLTRRALTTAASAVLVAATAACGASSGTSSVHRSVDARLCSFPLDIAVKSASRSRRVGNSALQFSFFGPSTITLRNGSTGRSATLDDSGTYSVDPKSGAVSFSGRVVWLSANGEHVPFLATSGKGTLAAPAFVLSGGAPTSTIDPCALVSASPPRTRPAATPAPWPLPSDALAQMRYAGLTPVVGTLVRHDHDHLDIRVDGRKIGIPAGVGLAEPADNGPCPAGPVQTGDCATRNIFTGRVATAPIHTHSTSGIIHVEPDRPGTYTLGEFFDEWGVRLTANCLGAYCTGGGKELRVYVDGRRMPGSPRSVALGNRQEIAVVFGGPASFRSVPSAYRAGWPGLGCGGTGEPSCLPPGS